MINEVQVTTGDRLIITVGMEDMTTTTQLRSYISQIGRAHRKAYKVPVSVTAIRSEKPFFNITIIKG